MASGLRQTRRYPEGRGPRRDRSDDDGPGSDDPVISDIAPGEHDRAYPDEGVAPYPGWSMERRHPGDGRAAVRRAGILVRHHGDPCSQHGPTSDDDLVRQVQQDIGSDIAFIRIPGERSCLRA